MHFALYGKVIQEENCHFVNLVFSTLTEAGIRISVYDIYYERLKDMIDMEQYEFEIIEMYTDLKKLGVDILLSLGGDGTILTASLLSIESRTPILGVNLGRLGFLASVEESRFKAAIQKILKGQYELEIRSMLELSSNKPLFMDKAYALNDMTISKRDTSAMIVIHTYVDGEFLTSYWADGIIVSTPTGSTGYSLSCGGPIVEPRANNFVLTPVSPHNLSVRPIVLSDSSVLRFEIEGRAENFLCTLDSRYATITHDYVIEVRRARYHTNLVKFRERNFMKTIREKMNWGSDSRNI